MPWKDQSSVLVSGLGNVVLAIEDVKRSTLARCESKTVSV